MVKNVQNSVDRLNYIPFIFKKRHVGILLSYYDD